jgi:hypothetical protein
MRTPIVAAVALATLAFSSTAEAHGGQPLVITEVIQDSAVVPFVGCSGEVAGIVAIDFRDTFHLTEFADGHVSVSANTRGTYFYEPFVGQPESGHFKSGFHVTVTDGTFVSHDVFTGAGVNVEGVHTNFNVRNHTIFANGEVRVEYSAGCD